MGVVGSMGLNQVMVTHRILGVFVDSMECAQVKALCWVQGVFVTSMKCSQCLVNQLLLLYHRSLFILQHALSLKITTFDSACVIQTENGFIFSLHLHL